MHKGKSGLPGVNTSCHFEAQKWFQMGAHTVVCRVHPPWRAWEVFCETQAMSVVATITCICVLAGTAMHWAWMTMSSRTGATVAPFSLRTWCLQFGDKWNREINFQGLLCSISSLKTYHFGRTNLSSCGHGIGSSNCSNSWDFKQIYYLKLLFFRDLLVHDSIVPREDSYDHLSLTIPFCWMLPQKEMPPIFKKDAKNKTEQKNVGFTSKRPHLRKE